MPASQVSAEAIQTLEWAHFLAGALVSWRSWSKAAKGEGGEAREHRASRAGTESHLWRGKSWQVYEFHLFARINLSNWFCLKCLENCGSGKTKQYGISLPRAKRWQTCLDGHTLTKRFELQSRPSADAEDGSSNTRVVSSVPCLLLCN